MTNINKFLLVSISFYLISAIAAEAAIIPCKGLDCKDFCQLTELVGKVINFGLKVIAIPLAAALIAWGGITILMAGGSPEKAKKGRDIITAAVIGVVIALTAWLILSTLLQILTGSGFSPWKLGSASFCNK